MKEAKQESRVPSARPKDPLALIHRTPESRRTLQMCWDAVRADGGALDFVPKAYRTEDICLEVVSRDGMALQFVPEALQTEGLVPAALRQEG